MPKSTPAGGATKTIRSRTSASIFGVRRSFFISLRPPVRHSPLIPVMHGQSDGRLVGRRSLDPVLPMGGNVHDVARIHHLAILEARPRRPIQHHDLLVLLLVVPEPFGRGVAVRDDSPETHGGGVGRLLAGHVRCPPTQTAFSLVNYHRLFAVAQYLGRSVGSGAGGLRPPGGSGRTRSPRRPPTSAFHKRASGSGHTHGRPRIPGPGGWASRSAATGRYIRPRYT